MDVSQYALAGRVVDAGLDKRIRPVCGRVLDSAAILGGLD